MNDHDLAVPTKAHIGLDDIGAPDVDCLLEGLQRILRGQPRAPPMREEKGRTREVGMSRTASHRPGRSEVVQDPGVFHLNPVIKHEHAVQKAIGHPVFERSLIPFHRICLKDGLLQVPQTPGQEP